MRSFARTLGGFALGLALLSCGDSNGPQAAPVPIIALSTRPVAATLAQGTTLQLAASAIDTARNLFVPPSVSWVSSNPAVASVSSSGLVTAATPGNAVITGSVGGFSASTTVTVPVPAGANGPGIPAFTMAVSVKGDYGITIVRSDGTVESTISCGTQCSFLAGPNWSRDGSKLAITGRRDTLSVLFVVNRDGTNLHEVASAPRLFIALPNHTAYWTEFHEDWSTDGRLVYVRSTPAGNNIETIAADGTGRLTVMATTDSIRTPADVFVTTNPRWGLGDSMISLERSSQVYAMNPDGSNLRALTSVAGGAFQHTWSPDGNSIAFSNSASNQWAIWVLDPVSSSLRQIAVPALSSFCWAPNSAGFSLVSQPSAQENWKSIYTLNRDGSGLQKSVIAVMDMLDQVIGAWSPDGRFLVYMDDRSSAGGPAGAQLYAQSLAERTNTRLGNAQNVIFFSVAAARGCGGSFAYP